MKRDYNSDVIQLFNILKKRLPTKTPVVLRRVKISNYDGLCHPPEEKGQPIKIELDSTNNLPLQMEALVHEYSHALDIDQGRDSTTGCHDGRWGKTYAKVYRCVEKYYIDAKVYEKKRKGNKNKS